MCAVLCNSLALGKIEWYFIKSLVKSPQDECYLNVLVIRQSIIWVKFDTILHRQMVSKGPDKMVAISLLIYSHVFSWTKISNFK